jgi:hypothetical protein
MYLHVMCIRIKFPGINPHLRPSNVGTEPHDIVVLPSIFPTSSKLPHII